MSAYGPDGAENLFRSVSQVGAAYYDDLLAAAGATGGRVTRGAGGEPVRWLVVVPLADAVTLPECALPSAVIVVSALHGGLLGDPAVLPMVSSFLSGRQVTDADDQLREEAELITSAATAWRMPDTSSACQQ